MATGGVANILYSCKLRILAAVIGFMRKRLTRTPYSAISCRLDLWRRSLLLLTQYFSLPHELYSYIYALLLAPWQLHPVL